MSTLIKGDIRPFGIRDKIGYAFGDFGNDFMFYLASSFLMVFYTKIMGISGGIVAALFLVARIVDAFSDVTVGIVVDKAKQNPKGKYRVFILRIALPVAIMSFLMYQTFTINSPMIVRIVYMYVTYILWGILYSCINIPYGTMASVISPEAKDRTSLSTFRSIGSTMGQMVVTALVPLIVYTSDSHGNQVIRGGDHSQIFALVAGIFSICSIICYAICYNLTRERVASDSHRGGGIGSIFRMIKFAISSRAMIGLLLGALSLLMAFLYLQQMANFIYPDYFQSASMLSGVMSLGPLLTLFICAPLAIPLGNKFGHKNLALAGALLIAVPMYIAYILHTHNVWVFSVLFVIAFMGIGLFNTIVWAMVVDVIDDIEVTKGMREDATCYSIYSFARKLGQAVAGWFAGVSLTWINYKPGANSVQSKQTLSGLYTYSTLLPAIFATLLFIFIAFVYPLGHKRVLKNVAILKQKENGNVEN
jgi:glycoside/pentoside/hexuronide:cation symporter, GPH family